MKKFNIMISILLMAIGFASISTTLIIKNNTKIAENKDDFLIYFSGAVLDKEDYTNEIISNDKQTITFETKELSKKNDESVLEYEITNGSTQYDVSFEIKVNTEENDILEVINEIDESDLLARETRKGKLTLRLKNGATEEKNAKVNVEIIFNGEERESINNAPIEVKTYSISGYFVDENNNIIPNATLAVYSNNPQYVKTDDYGYFYVGNLERGKHEIYYIEESEIGKEKEEIKENAIDIVSVTTSNDKDIIFENEYKIIDEEIKEEEKNTVTILLIKNNGEENETLELEENKIIENLPIPNNTGKEFLYWEDENGIRITDNTILSKKITNKLYAVYKANTYTITYNGNGGSGSPYKTTCTYGENCVIEENKFTKVGYEFINWRDEKNNEYSAGSSVKNLITSGNINFYVNWNPTTLYYLIESKADKKTTINFSVRSGVSKTNGIYTTTNTSSGKEVYYYRGNVDNNLIYNNMCWKIIRTTESGGVKLIYNGTPDNGKCSNTGSSTILANVAFNEKYTDNAYVGYMYGSAGATTYKATHTNTNSSTIKTYIDNWFKNKFTSSAQNKLEDTIFCNDRNTYAYDSNLIGTSEFEPYGALGYGTNATLYASAFRAYNYAKKPNPTLICKNTNGNVNSNNDSFTVNSSNGNGKLTYPVGLITLDEAVYAGFNTYASNTSNYKDTNNYLYSGISYWTMSPIYTYSSGTAGMGIVSSNFISHFDVYASKGVRPVLSLKSGTKISSGSGTTNSPYVVS